MFFGLYFTARKINKFYPTFEYFEFSVKISKTSQILDKIQNYLSTL